MAVDSGGAAAIIAPRTMTRTNRWTKPEPVDKSETAEALPHIEASITAIQLMVPSVADDIIREMLKERGGDPDAVLEALLGLADEEAKSEQAQEREHRDDRADQGVEASTVSRSPGLEEQEEEDVALAVALAASLEEDHVHSPTSADDTTLGAVEPEAVAPSQPEGDIEETEDEQQEAAAAAAAPPAAAPSAAERREDFKYENPPWLPLLRDEEKKQKARERSGAQGGGARATFEDLQAARVKAALGPAPREAPVNEPVFSRAVRAGGG